MNDNTSSLSQLHKLIRSLRKQEIEQIQQQHGDALKQIATIVRENDLSFENVQMAMSVRTAKEGRHSRALMKTRKKRANGSEDILTLDATTK